MALNGFDDEQIKEAVAKGSPFELSVRTVGKFIGGAIALSAVLAGIVTTVVELILRTHY